MSCGIMLAAPRPTKANPTAAANMLSIKATLKSPEAIMSAPYTTTRLCPIFFNDTVSKQPHRSHGYCECRVKESRYRHVDTSLLTDKYGRPAHYGTFRRIHDKADEPDHDDHRRYMQPIAFYLFLFCRSEATPLWAGRSRHPVTIAANTGTIQATTAQSGMTPKANNALIAPAPIKVPIE